ncbi:MAG: DUF1553 domain-containing protein, partial [Verrucomicrobiota bacterium]|nr:DUF1553 domain-containing protein [Verrucomicrobiota bacterium]
AQVVAEREKPRVTFVHVRGNFLDRGQKVEPGTPEVLHPLKRGEKTSRLELANWLVDQANPLTARVTVNHLWRNLFGEGLVKTVADFGTQGDQPSHPELLDWLAVTFMEQGWSRKQLIRTIVLSSTYRQSSEQREELVTRDPKNRMLARQNRFRLSGENARDQYLAASGLLDRTIGGESVGPESKRRGLYLKFKRSFPEYMLVAFDAPTSTAPCPARERSNTPLQALTLLNDELFVRSARELGRRALYSSDQLPARLGYLFRSAVARNPDEEEQRILTEAFHGMLEHYKMNPEAAWQLSGLKLDQQDAPVVLAAHIALARTILNLDEVITRE